MIVKYEKLHKVLKYKDISLEMLRKKIKISPSSIDKIRNQEMIGDSVIQKICDYLKCSVSDIMEIKQEAVNVVKAGNNKKYKVISLFSGAGGMDLGFIQAGFEIIWANDVFTEAISTYKRNIGNHIVNGDVRLISSNQIPNKPDVIIGGFPCQGFSINNKNRSMKDQRNFLYKEMLRIIRDKKPKMFVAENVKGLLSMERGQVFEMIKSDFEKIGYYVEARILNAAEYGVPQQRERLVIIGSRIHNYVTFPKKTHYLPEDKKADRTKLKPAITCANAIGWLKNVRTQDKPIKLKNGKMIYQHTAQTNVAEKFWGRKYKVNQADICDYLVYWRNKAGLTTKQVDEFFGYAYTAGHWFRKDNNSGSIPNPDDWKKLKQLLKFDNKYDKQVTTLVEMPITFEQSLRITNWNRPSDTITATSPEIHINKMRRLSVRECAIIQTFPEDFIFEGNSIGSMYKQIGNAVPVLLAKQVAKCVKNDLKKG